MPSRPLRGLDMPLTSENSENKISKTVCKMESNSICSMRYAGVGGVSCVGGVCDRP